MVYDYDGNQLKAVSDNKANGDKDRGDFYDGAELSTEYLYDANGNMRIGPFFIHLMVNLNVQQ